MPFRAAILKLTAVCNLDCDYCYMFNLADRTYARVPKQMPLETALEALDRLVAHARKHDLDQLDLTLHGGEPTLWPLDRLAALLQAVRAVPDVRFTVGLQSNGLKPFSTALLELLRTHRCALGVSVDGPQAVHDAHRVTRAGDGSYTRIMANVEDLLSRGYGDVFGGFLAVMDPDTDPHAFWDWILTLPVPRLDVLWPIGHHHDALPFEDAGAYALSPRYGAWLAALFDRWFAHDDPGVQLRGFWDLLGVLMGGQDHFDGLVNNELSQVVVNTDGSLEAPDYLRAAFDGACATGLDIRRHSLDEAARHPVFARLLALGEHRPAACEACPLAGTCGGGFVAGRNDRQGLRLDQPSALCLDHYHFYAHVQNRALAARLGTLPPRLPAGVGLMPGPQGLIQV